VKHALLKNGLPAILFTNCLLANLFTNCLPANLFKKGLIENEAFEFEELILEPYRHDQPVQRLRVNSCTQEG